MQLNININIDNHNTWSVIACTKIEFVDQKKIPKYNRIS